MNIREEKEEIGVEEEKGNIKEEVEVNENSTMNKEELEEELRRGEENSTMNKEEAKEEKEEAKEEKEEAKEEKEEAKEEKEEEKENKEGAIKKEAELKEALQLGERKKFRELFKKKKALGLGGLAFLAIVVGVIAISTYKPKPPLNKELNEEVSEFNCSLENDTFYVEPVKLKTEIDGYDVHMDIDIPKEDIVSIDNYDNFTLAVYTDGDELNQLLVTDTLPKEIETKEFSGKGLGNEVKVKINEKSAQSLKKLNGGYLYYEENKQDKPKEEEVKEEITKLSEKIQYSEHKTTHNVKLNIDGLGELNLDSLSVFQNDAGMYYGKDHILRLYNNKDDIAYIWITHVNNSIMMNPVGNLQSTEYNNVYVDVDYNNPEKMGYKTYAIMTEKGLYSVKFNEKAPDGLEDEFLNCLGINKDDTKIELPFKLNE